MRFPSHSSRWSSFLTSHILTGIMSETSASTCPHVVASHPFNQPSADIYLRTTDHVHFYVHRQILSQASSVFADMFTLPQPPESSEAPPIVDVTEDSKTLDQLLRLCYPINKRELGNLDDVIPVLKAAMKYEMEWPVSIITRDLLSIAPQTPLHTWAVACRAGLEEVARKAASEIRGRAAGPAERLELLKTMLQKEGLLQTLDGVHAGDYFRLREFLRSNDSEPRMALLSRTSCLPLETTLLSGFMTGYASNDLPRVFPSSVSHSSSNSPTSHGVAPFVAPSSPAPDVVVACREGSRIQAHKIVLIIHSFPVARYIQKSSASLHTLSSSTTTRGAKSPLSKRPIIEVDLEPSTAYALLRLCYEGKDSLPTDLPTLARLIVATDKYGMSQASVAAQQRWETAAGADPLGAYFIALHYQLNAQARGAAKAVLAKPLTGEYVPCMEDAPSITYHRLLVYYSACATAVSDELEKGYNYNYGRLGCLGRTCEITPSWLAGHLRSLKVEVESRGPGKIWEVTTDALLTRSQSETVWPSCTATQCRELVTAFVQTGSSLSQAIAQAISQVELEI
ncbi:hypothetical protein C8Q74DRAFT_575495 [Fomes fomentarius]|nr:hypothetical protein C8Q74DRAFT_575495 [Fomes fomentarius]